MKKFLQLAFSVSVLAGLLTAVSCKDDDAPPAPSKLSFAVSSMVVNEADGVIEVEIVLDKPALEKFSVDYKVSGTAQDAETATNNTPAADFRILEDLSDYGEVDFDKGQSVGIIQIQLYSDFNYESDEIIEIELIDDDSDLVEITRNDEIKITIKQEDGLLVILTWDYNDVDLDLFLWAEDNAGNLGLTNLSSTSIGFGGIEGFFLPTALLDDGDYGLSCTYYEGTADPMNFEVDFIKIENGIDVSTVTKPGTYGLENINEWDNSTTGIDPVLVQTFEKSGTNFINFSEIDTPPSGSRILGSKLPPDVHRTQGNFKSKRFKKIQ